jgi:oligopeptide/dipeptide ABC transporter ATP-binding protein
VAASYPHQLSGGMRQRALIAIAIACQPKMLIADEPTTALDVTVQAQVLELLVGLQRELGMGLLMVTHDVEVARDIADVVAVMYAGRIVERGTASEVLDEPTHPYTAGLLRAVPAPSIPRGHLQAIPGKPPGADEVPTFGCAFAPRCVLATSGCVEATPTLLHLSSTHEAACPPAVKIHRPEALLADGGGGTGSDSATSAGNGGGTSTGSGITSGNRNDAGDRTTGAQ